MKNKIFFAVVLLIIFCAANVLAEGGEMKIQSSAFNNEDMIPKKYTCDGQDISPSLEWTGVPESAKSLVLISDDPDAPMGTWIHWVMFNIPPNVSSLSEAVPSEETLSDGTIQGITSFGKSGYGGPCPPGGTHRYFFKLYALDTQLDLGPSATKKDVEKAMKGHVLAESQVMGKYQRQ